MLIEHEGRAPQVDPSAWVAPTAVLSGDVRRRYADLFGRHRDDRIVDG